MYVCPALDALDVDPVLAAVLRAATAAALLSDVTSDGV
jgi:hypothetical protein